MSAFKVGDRVVLFGNEALREDASVYGLKHGSAGIVMTDLDQDGDYFIHFEHNIKLYVKPSQIRHEKDPIDKLIEAVS